MTSTSGYVKISTGKPVTTKSTNSAGTITTITNTTTVTWHKPVTMTKNVTINDDDNGNALTSTSGYKEITIGKVVQTKITAKNGDVTITNTTTNIWHKPIITTNTVTVNYDHEANDGYTSIDVINGLIRNPSGDVTKTESSTASNGDVTITTTTYMDWIKDPNYVPKTTTTVDAVKNLNFDDPDVNNFVWYTEFDTDGTYPTDDEAEIAALQSFPAISDTSGLFQVDSTGFYVGSTTALNGDVTSHQDVYNFYSKNRDAYNQMYEDWEEIIDNADGMG